MANKYNDILTLVNAGNQMGLSNTIKRDYGIPLDFTSVQETYDAAVAYAATSTLAYVGQTVAVGGKLYIITDVANGTHTVGEGEDARTYDNYLAEVGSKTEGDGNTIELDGQTLKLAGLTGLDNSKTYVPSLVNGKLVWAEPDTSTAEGQAQEINALKTRAAALEATVNGVEAAEGTEAKEGLVDKVAANESAISGEATARENADKAITDKIGAVAEGKTVVEMIEDAEAAAKAAIPANVSAFNNDAGYLTTHQDISGKADKATTLEGYGITDAYTQTEVNNLIAGITHFTTKVVSSTDEVTETGILYLIKDEVVTGTDKYNEYLFIDGVAVLIGDTTTDLSDYITNGALTEAIKDFVTTTALTTALEPYAKTADVNSALAHKANAAEVVANTAFEEFKTANNTAIAAARTGAVADIEAKGYAVASEVEGAYAKKGTTLAEYGITDAYTKAETVAKGDVYTKTQVDALLDEVSGGSSETAASVKRALDGYIQNIDTELYGADTVAKWTLTDDEGQTTYAPQYSVDDSRLDKAIAAAAAAQGQADKGVEDAAKAQGVADAAKAQADTNKGDIDAVKGRLTILETAKGDHETRISTAEGKITALETATTNNSNAIGELQGKDTELVAEDERLAGLITTLQSDKADKSATYTKTETNDAIAAAIAKADLGTYAKAADVEAIYKAGVDGGAATGILAEEIARAKAAEEANARAISAIIGEDSNKTIRVIAAEETAKIVAGADTKYDTLKEIADFITNDETGAAAMANDIAALKEKVDTGDKTVAAYVAGAIAALPVATAEVAGIVKASEEVAVATDGTMSVTKVKASVIDWTDADLIINGGNAGAKAAE